MRMEGQFDPGVDRSFSDFIQVMGQRLRIGVAEIFGSVTGAMAKVDLQMLAAEMGDVAGPGGVALDSLVNFRGVQILAAASDRRQRETRRFQDFFERFWRLVQVLGNIFLKWLESVIPVAGGHLNSSFGMRRGVAEFVPAHRETHFVASRGLGGQCGAGAGGDKFAAVQHRGNLLKITVSILAPRPNLLKSFAKIGGSPFQSPVTAACSHSENVESIE